MNPEIKARWVAALRSGEYRQGGGKLRTPSGNYCCLGVLCELAVQDGVIQPPVPGAPASDGWRYGLRDEGEYDVSTVELPRSVVTWAGLDDPDPKIRVDPDPFEGGGEPYLTSLSQLNDSGELDFNEIAKIIEVKL